MDETTVRAMLEQHFASRDPDLSHAMYHDDAVLEFPQSGERFVGVGNLRGWRSNYPAQTAVEFREIRGRDDLWVAEISIRYDAGPWNFGVSILEFRGQKIARESIYVTEGWEPRSGGLNGGPPPRIWRLPLPRQSGSAASAIAYPVADGPRPIGARTTRGRRSSVLPG